MKQIIGGGIDLAKLKGGADEMAAPFIHPMCPGALVRVTREDLRALIQGGEVFDESRTKVPYDGYGDARVICRNPVHAWVGCAGNVVYAGRCRSCEGLEAENRVDLRGRQQLSSGNGRREAAG